jgi:hypothetical protein
MAMANTAFFQPFPVRTAPSVVKIATKTVTAQTRAPKLKVSAMRFLHVPSAISRRMSAHFEIWVYPVRAS